MGTNGLKWIRFSISTMKYLVRVYRGHVSFFSAHKLIKQRDPLLPFLFSLAVEGLSKMLEQSKQMQWIQGFSAGTNTDEYMIFHLLYVDYTLIFCEAKDHNILPERDTASKKIL